MPGALAGSMLVAGLMMSGCDLAPDPAERLEDLAERYWEWNLEAHPTRATFLGLREHAHRLQDITPDGRESRRQALEGFREELDDIDREALGGQDLLTHVALEEELRDALAVEACGFPEWGVDHRNGPPASLFALAQVQPLERPEDGRAMVERWRAMGPFLRQHVSNLRAGLPDGFTPPRSPVELTLRQLEEALAAPDEEWPLLEEPLAELPEEWDEEERQQVRRDLEAAVANEVRPAMEEFRDFLEEEALPRARDGDGIGVTEVPGGEACYDALIRNYTTLELTAEDIHEFGLREIDRIRDEMRTLGERALGTSRLEEIQERLRTDPDLHFPTEEEILEVAREATERARNAMPEWFGRLPEADVEVRPIPAHEAPYTTIAYYRRPAADGSRPGIYFVNTYAPETRPRYEAEALAFHEAIPGHHLQIAIAQEIPDLPAFRRHGGATAFVEGWALYAERLSDEMGLYSADLDRMGMLSYDAWRAARLVVDTGIHALGWTRDEAVDYMLENTLLARNNVENEVDRYIAWPGQALAYKIGQREIFELRGEARDALGDEFRIQDFHDRVLENGAVSLASLRSVVEEWMESR